MKINSIIYFLILFLLSACTLSRQTQSKLYLQALENKPYDVIIVPGKVLSVGTLSKNITIAALQFSADAQRKIVDAKGKIMTIPELLQQNPEGKNVRILG